MRPRLCIACLAAVLICAAAAENPGITTEPAGWSLGEQPLTASPSPSLKRPVPAQSGDTEATEDEKSYLAPAREGQAWAQTRLGALYANARNDPARWKRGAELLRLAAQKNDTEALYLLAGMAADGRGMEASASTSFEYMERAAKLGQPEAQYALALMYTEGRGTSEDERAATDWARRAAGASNANAMFFLGRTMLGAAEQARHEEGLAWMHKAASLGCAPAALFLGTAYGRGEKGLVQDEAKAEAVLKPAAEHGDADCQLALAGLYRFGGTFATKRPEAYVWLKRAAQNGQSRALEILESESTASGDAGE